MVETSPYASYTLHLNNAGILSRHLIPLPSRAHFLAGYVGVCRCLGLPAWYWRIVR